MINVSLIQYNGHIKLWLRFLNYYRSTKNLIIISQETLAGLHHNCKISTPFSGLVTVVMLKQIVRWFQHIYVSEENKLFEGIC